MELKKRERKKESGISVKEVHRRKEKTTEVQKGLQKIVSKLVPGSIL